jgi:hypothetical protein
MRLDDPELIAAATEPLRADEHEPPSLAELPPGHVLTLDGYIVDSESGEVVGVFPAPGEVEVPAGATRFEVADQEGAEWVLKRLAEAESGLAAVEARRAALNANLDAMAAEHRARIKFLEWRFGPELGAWAARAAAPGKKSVTTAWGRVGFRRAGGRIVPRDPEAALAWAREHAPEAVKVAESLLVSKLKGREESLPGELFEVTEVEDAFYYQTGVGKGAKDAG